MYKWYITLVYHSGGHLVQPVAQTGLCKAGCSGLCPDSV